jgi:hypothetical protein
MRNRASVLAVGMIAAATMVVTAPAASAACVGSENTVIMCVDPTGGTLYEDCIYAGDPPCTPVHVPGPLVWCEPTNGPLVCDG